MSAKLHAVNAISIDFYCVEQLLWFNKDNADFGFWPL